MDLKKTIREIPDFPKKGILFYDITTLLKDANALKFAADKIFEHYKNEGKTFDKVVSIESRGFIFGAILAYKFNEGFVPIRKQGKLPGKSLKEEYEKEYGKDIFELHEDSIEKGEKILLCDDVLATGGTAQAAIRLIEKMQGKINGIAPLIEIEPLNGRKKLTGYDVYSLIKYQ